MPAQNCPPFRSEVLVELHVPDFQRAYDFYKLFGFKLQWMEDGYMVLKHGSQALCFYGGEESVREHHFFGAFPEGTLRGYGVEVILFIDTIDDFFRTTSSKMKVVSALELRPWGKKDFRVEDPFGYYLRISEPYDTVEAADKDVETKKILAKTNFRL